MASTSEDEIEKPLNFHDMELDDRVLKAIAIQGWSEPTLIQERAIPLLLQGKDVLLRARTGSGKTGAFAVPVIQRILVSKQVATEQSVKALVLAPSKELCKQITTVIQQLTCKCSRDVRVVDISQTVDLSVQKPLLISNPDIVVATPARALVHLKAGSLLLKTSLEMLVVDEADLVFSYGYETEIKEVLSHLPPVYQAVLASATLSDDVMQLKKLVLHNAVILKLEEPALAPASQLQHYHFSAQEDDKAAILYALLKLHLIRGKTIIFVNTVDRCYKLKIFLEQFGIPTVVLNSELPAASRCHSVSQFNQGIYDIIIASDEATLDEPEDAVPSKKKKKKTGGGEQKDSEKTKRKKDKESGVSRGIDFQFVSNVINFDFPPDINSYVHRVGRTARGKNKGTALSFVSLREQPLLDKVEEHLTTDQGQDEKIFKAFQFKLEEVEAFRYRAKDAWRATTRVAVREARLKEIRLEIVNSNALKSYFDDNPKDLTSLRHDKALHTVKLQSHLTDVPDYIVPKALKRLAGITGPRKRPFTRKPTRSYHEAKMNNPLLNMEVMGLGKRKRK